MSIAGSLSRLALAVLACAGAPALAQQPSPEQLEQVTKMFKEADANDDGKTTREEMNAHRANTFARLDMNSDGVVNASDKPRGPVRAKKYGEAFGKVVPQFDKNGDGTLTKQEWNTQEMDVFGMLDANGDGAIETAELPNPASMQS